MTNRVSHRLAQAGLLLSLLLLAGCKSLLTSGSPSISGVSPAVSSPISSVEREIGRREHPKVVKAYGGVYSNAKVEAMVSKLVGRLVAASTEPNRPYRVTILNSPAINAFALPGGYLYVTRGLLALANDKAELAAVLAHEMAHVTARHALARAEARQKNELLSRVMDDMVGKTPRLPASRQRTWSRWQASVKFRNFRPTNKALRPFSAPGLILLPPAVFSRPWVNIRTS